MILIFVRQNIPCELVSPVETVVAVAVVPRLWAIFLVVAVQIIVWVFCVVEAEVPFDFFDCHRWCIHKIMSNRPVEETVILTAPHWRRSTKQKIFAYSARRLCCVHGLHQQGRKTSHTRHTYTAHPRSRRRGRFHATRFAPHSGDRTVQVFPTLPCFCETISFVRFGERSSLCRF
jgi:hypothetical protein